MPEHDPVYKVTIIPRGRALGVTMFLPEEDRYSTSKRRLESRIATLFGGRVAEEIIFGPEDVTTGASNDIERATEIARNMVTKWGLSDTLGPLTYAEDDGEVFLGRQVTQHKQVSDVTAHVIDEEVRRVIDTNYQRAKDILSAQHRQAAHDGRGADQVRDHRRRADPRHHGTAASRRRRRTGKTATCRAAAPSRGAAGRRRPERPARAAALTHERPALAGRFVYAWPAMQLLCRDIVLDLAEPAVMGVLNVTPDSFSDGGRYADVRGRAWRAAWRMAARGCGASSTSVANRRGRARRRSACRKNWSASSR